MGLIFSLSPFSCRRCIDMRAEARRGPLSRLALPRCINSTIERIDSRTVSGVLSSSIILIMRASTAFRMSEARDSHQGTNEACNKPLRAPGCSYRGLMLSALRLRICFLTLDTYRSYNLEELRRTREQDAVSKAIQPLTPFLLVVYIGSVQHHQRIREHVWL